VKARKQTTLQNQKQSLV